MNKPNIILINCDDLGYGDLSCYGSTRNRTPALDQLAAEGVRFTDFYSASSLCSPSRGAMMTGCYPARVGFGLFNGRGVLFPGDPIGLHENEHTLPQLLKDDGYRTKIIGKWHCGDQPEFLPCNRGFDEYYGIPFSNDMGMQRRSHDNQLPPLPLVRDDEVIQEQPEQSGLTERYTEETVRFIRYNKDRPFFLYLAHMYVHVPIFVPDRFMKQSQNGPYGGAVEHIDWTTRVIMDELERQGLTENTIVIFTSDNGSRARDEGGSNAPCSGVKGTQFEGGFRVPCIMRWPAQIPGGRVSAEMISSIDFLPSLIALTGGTRPTDNVIDGVDQSALITGKSEASARDTFAYYMGNNCVAVRKNEWKLHLGNTFNKETKEHSFHEPVLYNLKDDVGETTNVADKFPAVVAELSALIDSIRAELGDGAHKIEGTGVRPSGRVENGKPLTEYDANHPYMIASYDLPAGRTMAG